MKYQDCIAIAPGFDGANLVVVHTLVDWQGMDIFNMAKTIKQLNFEAGLDSFIMMVCPTFQYIPLRATHFNKKLYDVI